MAESEVSSLLKQLIALQEQSQRMSEVHCRALDALAKRVNGLTQVPFGVFFMALISYFFYTDKITEIYWCAGCAIAALPYYSEYVPLMLKVWQKEKQQVSIEVKK
jgi:hypothetical protein